MTIDSDPRDHFAITDVNRVRRYPHRGRYDRATVFGILDCGLVAHVAFVDDGRPVVVPMAYGHDGERVFLHGAHKGRIGTAAVSDRVCIAVTLVDGLVVARSLFDTSMNYRAVVIHGRAAVVDDSAERLEALRRITEHAVPGRWAEVRAPSLKHLKATVVLAVEIETASAKVREGGVVEDADAPDADVRCGVVPLITTVGAPMTDANVPSGVAVPASVHGLGARVSDVGSDRQPFVRE